MAPAYLNESKMEKGGVGLVFVNDDSGSMFLHIARVVPDGPADMSGMLAPGDRLVAIDGIEIGSVAPGESPQVHTYYALHNVLFLLIPRVS